MSNLKSVGIIRIIPSISEIIHYSKTDLSLRLLILSNVLIIIFAFIESWSPGPIMLLYWFQSLLIGIFTFIRIISKTDSLSQSFGVLGKIGGWFFGIFFLIHYGGFHIGYLFFLVLMSFFIPNFFGPDFFILNPLFLISILVILINHIFSEIYNSGDYIKKTVGKIFSEPYSRIIPMHLTIIFGMGLYFSFNNTYLILILFLILKTLTDINSHINKHKTN